MQYRMRHVITVIGLIMVWGCKTTAKVQEVIPSPPKRDFSTVIAKARELYKSGESQKAMEIADGLLLLDPQSALLHELRGEILLDTGKFPEAITSLKKAQEIAPGLFTAYLKEGFTHELLYEEKETLECLKKGIRIFQALSSEKEISKEDLALVKEATNRILELLPPVKVAVLYFEGDYEAISYNYERFIPGILISKLALKKRIRVRDPRHQSKFLEKYSLGMSGISKIQEAQRIGKLLKVDWVIMGSVYQDTDSFQINFKMLDVSSGTITYKDTVHFSSHKDAAAQCEEIVNKIVEHTI